MKSVNPVFASLGVTIFEVMSRLAMAHGAVNLGQGFPDQDGPARVLEAAAEAVVQGPNQYPPMLGIPDLRQAVAEHAARFYGLEFDWQTEVLVTSGATEALADCLLALLEPGDEAILIEPLYDSYLPIVRRAGAVPKFVRVEAPDWRLDLGALEAAFTSRTKLLLLNNPQNPTGKVFSRDELEAIAALLERHDAYAVCDEVYEHIVFDGRRHVPLISLPGMRERCLRIGSAGKSFSLTGWKVGYVTAAAGLLTPVAKAHQFVTFTTPPHLQKAVAAGLRLGDDYFAGLASGLAAKRDRFAEGLRRLGLDVLPCEGTYFVNIDARALGLGEDDVEVAQRLTVEAGVASVPVSAFHAEDPPRHLIRFCFSKRDEVLDEALRRLGAFLAGRRGSRSAA